MCRRVHSTSVVSFQTLTVRWITEDIAYLSRNSLICRLIFYCFNFFHDSIDGHWWNVIVNKSCNYNRGPIGSINKSLSSEGYTVVILLKATKSKSQNRISLKQQQFVKNDKNENFLDFILVYKYVFWRLCDENCRSYDKLFLAKFRPKLRFFSLLIYFCSKFLRNFMFNWPPGFNWSPWYVLIEKSF